MRAASGLERIRALFGRLAGQRRCGLGTYFVAGDHGQRATGTLLRRLPQHGADLIELGLPFSDPAAEGPAIQAGHLRALDSGTTPSDLFRLVSAFRREDDITPLLVMGYCNPVMRFGTAAFVEEAAAAGVDGLIIVDQPLEEAAELARACARNALAHVLIVAPTTSADRMAAIAGESTGFIYCAGAVGTTGTQPVALGETERRVAMVRAFSSTPVGVGFGIRSPAHAKAVGTFANLAIVGSTLVAAMERRDQDEAAEAVLATTRRLADALRPARGRSPPGTALQMRQP